jgi:hypothetical protein
LALTPGVVVEYEVVIGLGTVDELRKRFGEEAKREETSGK